MQAHFTNSLKTHIQFNNGCLGGGSSGWTPGLWWLAGHQSARVCVCLFCIGVALVVKSTLATVRLSISPVWQSWKELLFGGQSHPTLITGAARESWRGGMDLGGKAEVNGGTANGGGGGTKSLHTWATCCHLPFSAWLPPPFYLLGFFGLPSHTLACVLETLETPWRHTGTPWRPWHRLLRQHLSVPNCSLSLFYSSSPFSPIALSPLSSPPLSAPDSVVIINTPSSWADAWLESASSPVARRKSDRVGGEAQRVSESQVTQLQPDKWRLGCDTFTHVCKQHKLHTVVSVNVPVFERPQSKVYPGFTWNLCWKCWINKFNYLNINYFSSLYPHISKFQWRRNLTTLII